MKIDWDEFTLIEQILINTAVTAMNDKDKYDSEERLSKFLAKGFNNVCKIIAKKKF